ncbi:unnamed protein product [Rotaria sordida]|uniref:Uncharacterized protein n=1 Tax=Rotaria sordida TaxID=392033 RepID=A0A815FZE9_9BILA|nr:unnamed protein product [Rotaria sordida]CAF1345616.1 unnamed protein product [Rotaria sordida]CAF4013165.1 unnamed protein product [Rotaria sordida]CAF4143163.1 unnamed protein product [Rotaria sordida]
MISHENVFNNMTFVQLYGEGMTSMNLFKWSTTLDVAQRYERNVQNSSEIFDNCLWPWFSSIYQYRFDNNILSSLNNISQLILTSVENLATDRDLPISISYSLLSGMS